jgi:hypothetical protein
MNHGHPRPDRVPISLIGSEPWWKRALVDVNGVPAAPATQGQSRSGCGAPTCSGRSKASISTPETPPTPRT